MARPRSAPKRFRIVFEDFLGQAEPFISEVEVRGDGADAINESDLPIGTLWIATKVEVIK